MQDVERAMQFVGEEDKPIKPLGARNLLESAVALPAPRPPLLAVYKDALVEELEWALQAVYTTHDECHSHIAEASRESVARRQALADRTNEVLEMHATLHQYDPTLGIADLSKPGGMAFRNSAERQIKAEINKVHARSLDSAVAGLEALHSYIMPRCLRGLDISSASVDLTLRQVCEKVVKRREALHDAMPSQEEIAEASEQQYLVARDFITDTMRKTSQMHTERIERLQKADLQRHEETTEKMRALVGANCADGSADRRPSVVFASSAKSHEPTPVSSDEQLAAAAHREATASLQHLAHAMLQANEEFNGTPEVCLRRPDEDCATYISLSLSRADDRVRHFKARTIREVEAWRSESLGRIEAAYANALEIVYDEVEREQEREAFLAFQRERLRHLGYHNSILRDTAPLATNPIAFGSRVKVLCEQSGLSQRDTLDLLLKMADELTLEGII